MYQEFRKSSYPFLPYEIRWGKWGEIMNHITAATAQAYIDYFAADLGLTPDKIVEGLDRGDVLHLTSPNDRQHRSTDLV